MKNLVLLSALSSISNLTIMGKMSHPFSPHPVFVGMQNGIRNTLTFRNFHLYNNYAPLVKGYFSSLILKDSVFQNSPQPLSGITTSKTLTIDKKKINETTAEFSNETLIITNCLFEDCRCEDSNGGAINGQKSIVQIANTTFQYCTSEKGGAIYLTGSKVTFDNVNFTTNLAMATCGAAYFHDCDVDITRGFSVSNSAIEGNGCFSFESSTVNIKMHHFIRNNANAACGCVFSQNSNMMINDSYFIHNHGASRSGAIEIFYTQNVIIHNCTFISNEITNGDSTNVVIEGDSNVTFSNCTFDAQFQTVVEYYSFGTQTVQKKDIIIDLNPPNPFYMIVDVIDDVLFQEVILSHKKSDAFTILMLVSVPIFVVAAFALLHFTK
ncbi:putative outer membrane protein pmp20 precursor [Histomonas meleagridis]|uniref:putative outer membrane protein pmp20 precursor n=1 Tax=Histomonas meleagridis TaxID=135588 RepID=UPI003559B632|nr:putative outer membrane protein pmp20 precursor [Histomonas meleagridis]KAH0797328.1 putative outer membrane protein pmp20 precursor [Histomonas meleagridis]